MALSERLEKIIARHAALGDKMMDPSSMSQQEYAAIAKERADLEDVVVLGQQYVKQANDLRDSEELAKDPGLDAELKDIVAEDIKTLKASIEELEHKIKIELLPKDAADHKNAILEIRAGTGGEEAALFAAELFRMYNKYADRKGWKFEVVAIAQTGLDGCKEAQAIISGKDVFANLKFESGVHRVQRVPETETSGRIHTSAATVAVLPEAEEVDIQLNESDLRIDVYRASGAGGQHVNTTDSAVRITHIPTGVCVSMQDEKSQHKNKAKAMKILLSRLYDNERQMRDSERSAMRKGQVGSGDRSERIRTYNYHEGRVTDHRIPLTLYKLPKVIYEGELDEFIDALVAKDQAERLANQG
ncbi:MAG: peptide chain release factor 1 [Candidatus Jidaibacter sp.]|jgi:peptide chain release factor 1|nr:peptide chain release factor 1 [Candidatus Jidaibacter sp.]